MTVRNPQSRAEAVLTGVAADTARSIDVIRGLAALGVIWGHAIYGLGIPIERGGASWLWWFLPISGYLAAHGMMHGGYGLTFRGYLRFLWNRGLRVLPLAQVALLIGLVLAGANGKVPSQFWRQFLLVAPANDMTLVGPLW